MVRLSSLVLLAGLLPLSAYAAGPSVDVPIHAVSAEGVGRSLGTISVEESAAGIVLLPKLEGLPPGPHGFHLHQNPSCEPKEKDGKMSAAEAAGPHYDPAKTGHHAGPSGEGHAGDLPVLTVDADGTSSKSLAAPKLKLADILGRSLMIHAGGDNYSDTPAPLGGGGARIACGVIPAKAK